MSLLLSNQSTWPLSLILLSFILLLICSRNDDRTADGDEGDFSVDRLSFVVVVHGQQLTFSAFGICAVGTDGQGYCDSSAGTDSGSIGGGPAVSFGPPNPSTDPFVQITQDTIHGICGLTAGGIYSCATLPVSTGPYTYIAALPQASEGGTVAPGTVVLDSAGKMIGIGPTAWISLVDSLSAIKFTQILTVDTAVYGVATDGHIECLNTDTMASCTNDIKGTTLNFALVATDVNQELCGIGYDSSWQCVDVSGSPYTSARPIPPVSIHEITQLAIGGHAAPQSAMTTFSCVLYVNATVGCFGYDFTSDLDMTNVIQISSSANLATYLGTDNWVGGLCLVHTDASMECYPGLNIGTNSVSGLAPQFKYRLGNQLLNCPLGRFSTGAGAVTSLCSGMCDIGYYGNTTGTSTTPECNGPCPPGTQCSQYGTGQPPLCPQGFYCPTSSTIFPCTIGHMCPNNGTIAPMPCPQGTLCNVTGIVSPPLCPIGNYCPDPTAAIACGPGTMCDKPGNVSPPPCSQYSYCPTCFEVEPCPLGTYSSSTGASDATCSGLCAPGYFGSVNTVSTSQCSGPCPPGTNCTYPGTVTPEPCPIGFYCPTALAALPCPPGTMCDRTQNINAPPCAQFSYCPTCLEIDPCPVGTYSSGTGAVNASCSGLCAPGHFGNTSIVETSQCSGPCPLGTTCINPGTVTPTLCPIGYECPTALAAVPCPPGTMCNTTGTGIAPPCHQFYYCPTSVEIYPCPLGRYSSTTGAYNDTCSGMCQPGYFGNVSTVSTSECSGPCPLGTLCLDPGTIQPVPCPQSFYCPTTSTIFPCSIGAYCPNNGTITPTTCPFGTLCNSTNTVTPILCPIGFYCPNPSTSAIPCGPGTMCEKPGNYMDWPCSQFYYCPTSVDIEPCPLGRYSSGTGAYNDTCSGLCQAGCFGNVSTVSTSECVGECPLGTLCLNPGTIQPEPCPLGWFCPTALTLNPCPTGTYGAQKSLVDSTDCTLCPANTASAVLNATSSSYCGLCPIGQGSLAGANACFSCPGNTFSDTRGGGCTPCQSAGCQGGPSCQLGYVGDLCSACAGGFYESSDSGNILQCLECQSTSIWGIVLLLLIFLIFVSIFLKLNASPVFRAMLVPIIIGTPFIQIFSFMRLIKFNWSHSTMTIMQTLGFLNLDLNQLQCFVSFQSTFSFILLSPIILVSFLLVGGFLLKCILAMNSPCLYRCLGRALDLEDEIGPKEDSVVVVVPQPVIDASSSLSQALLTPSRDEDVSVSINGHEMSLLNFRDLVWSKFVDTGRGGFISFCSFAYIFLCWQCLLIYDCENVAGSGIRVRENVTIECYSNEWRNYVFGSIAGILAYMIGIPAGFLFIIYRRSSIAGAALGATLTFLRPSMRWWVVGQILWNLSMVIVLRLLLEFTTAQVVLFSLLLLVRITISLRFHPYSDRMYNREEEILACLAALILVFGLIFFTGKLNSTQDRTLFVLTLLCIIGMFMTVAYYILWTYKIEKKKLHDTKVAAAAGLEPLNENSDLCSPPGNQQVQVDRSEPVVDVAPSSSSSLRGPITRSDGDKS